MCNSQNKALISVIAPVYNVENYIDKCVTSIVNQTYNNLEIILVDDGSTDSSGNKCDEWMRKDSRVVVVHKKNGGLSSARNLGIDVAKGEYLVFVDSDDVIHKEMISVLKKAVDFNKSDMAYCDLKIVNEDESIKEGNVAKDITYLNYSTSEFIKDWYDENEVIHTVAWNKIYKKDLFSKIRYPEGKLHEDEFTTYKVALLAKRITYVNEQLYFYMQRGNSITGKLNVKRLDVLEAFKERIDIAKEVDQDFYNNSNVAYLDLIINYYFKFKENDNYNVAKKLKNKFFEEYKRIRSIIHLTNKKKIRYTLFIINKKIYKSVFLKG